MHTLAHLPQRHFGAIVADPPWRFKTYNDAGRNRCPDWKRFKGSPARHYEVMDLDAVKALPVESLAAKDCALFLWALAPMLPEAFDVIAAWGFHFRTVAFTWAKVTRDGRPAIGCGYWTRAGSELCLLATRGSPKRLDRGVRQLILEPRREHSRKPDCVLERIRQLVPGPYLELFARERQPGWFVWGDQTDRFDAALRSNTRHRFDRAVAAPRQ